MARSSRRRESGGSGFLQGLLEETLTDLDLGAKVREQRALRAWAQVVGHAVAAHTRPEALRDGVLIVATDTPAWAQELTMRRRDMLAKLETTLGKGVVSDIHFRSGFRAPAKKAPPPEPRPADLALSPRQRQEIAQASARIEDPELRDKAARAFGSLARVSAWRKEQGWRRCGRCGQWQRTGKRWCSSCLHAGMRHDD